ncbi:hydroxymethylbilane synthase [Candidatus Desulfovibrio trichonymphae]|uniref:Porphobilinogen deaminase n=1 Tax=Candidatus Desulfovibrio trichonymphae TaxID=1725232 RepID=A0A1J1E3V0_9BACT|nr:hydroxymethylbilane synthase [Candidatus Desulfovibrio trichonymphae]BAV92128.1 porphobilinogen deaminase [Candidatus Desulfovibrio trichonymphae]
MQKQLVIATRGSRLALWQAHYVRDRLRALCPVADISLCVIKTTGDVILDVPLAKVGGKGLFVKEIEEALLDGRADLAVHSIKDVPMLLPAGLTLACVPSRENSSDCFLSVRHADMEALPEGASVGTGSLRRQAQLLEVRPDLHIANLRGNVETRLRKMQDGGYDAIILASAAVRRLNLAAPHMHFFDVSRFLPAAGQGALGIECRADDDELKDVLRALEDRSARCCVEAERSLLAGLEGGCQVPVAAHARLLDKKTLFLSALVAEVDGSRVLRGDISGTASDAGALGLQLADNLLKMGARDILDKLLG